MSKAITYEAFVGIYGGTMPVSEIEQDGNVFTQKFGLTAEELTSNNDYQRKKETVKTLKEALEKSLEASFDEQTQVKGCLSVVKNVSVYEKLENDKVLKLKLLHDLIFKQFGQSWGPKANAHFEDRFAKLRDYRLFFISYTNEGSHLLNDEYNCLVDKLIKKLDGSDLTPKDKLESNLVAEKAVYDFTKTGIPIDRIFYDKRDTKIADDLEKTILPHSEKSIAFIQLIHEETWTEDWPFKEFNAYKGPIYCFLVCHKDLKAIEPKWQSPDIKNWYSKVTIMHHEHLTNDYPNYKDVIRKVSGEIHQQIDKYLFDIS